MEDKIFDIVTDLIRDDISKDEAIDKLLVLYNVSKRSFVNVYEDEHNTINDKRTKAEQKFITPLCSFHFLNISFNVISLTTLQKVIIFY